MSDRLLCGVIAGEHDIPCSKISYAMYLMQCAGYDLGYKYSVGIGELKSHGIYKVMNGIVAEGYLTSDYTITDYGMDYLGTVVLTKSEDDRIELIMDLCDGCSKADLFFICVADILIEGSKSSKGVQGLLDDKEAIQSSLRNLCGDFTEKWFNTVVSVLREIRGGLK